MARHRSPAQQRTPSDSARHAADTGSPKISLGVNHRRGIASTLGLLDETLARFEHWISGQPAEGALYRESDTLTAEQKAAIRAEIEALRGLMSELRDDLRLEIRTQDIGTAIWAHISAFWEALVELKVKSLRRYGDVPGGLAEYLDPRIEQVIERIARIAEVARQPKPSQESQRRRRAR